MPISAPLRPRFKDMIDLVVDAGACAECGNCVAACPHRVIEMRAGKPAKLASAAGAHDHCGVSEGIGCDICAAVCPRLWPREPQLRDAVFDGSTAYEGIFGVYRHVFVARTRDAGLQASGQDGGVVTALLAWARREGLIDGAVVASVGEGDAPCFPSPKIASTEHQIRASSGSWYTYCPNNLMLARLAKSGISRAGFVGVPCQITALRKLQTTDPSMLLTKTKQPQVVARQRERLTGTGERVALSIGLFCTEVFRPELMTERIARDMGIPLDQIERFNVKGEVLIHQRDGSVATIPLETAMHEFQRPECSHCGDFSAELADIACGGIGTDRATLVVLRSERSVQAWRAFEAAGEVDTWPIQEHKKAWNILQRLARRQRARVPRESPGATAPARWAPDEPASATASAGDVAAPAYRPARQAQAYLGQFRGCGRPLDEVDACIAAAYGPRPQPAAGSSSSPRAPIPGDPGDPEPGAKRVLPPPPPPESGGASPGHGVGQGEALSLTPAA